MERLATERLQHLDSTDAERKRVQAEADLRRQALLETTEALNTANLQVRALEERTSQLSRRIEEMQGRSFLNVLRGTIKN
jgi:hypothetical protein